MSSEVKIPVWFWIVGIVVLLWNGYSLWDYYNSVSLNEEYLSAYPGYLDFVLAMPMWAKGAWGLATMTGVLASLCLLTRRAWAYPLFILSLLGMIGTAGDQFTSKVMPELTTGILVFTMFIVVVGVLLVIYAKMMKAKGWLR